MGQKSKVRYATGIDRKIADRKIEKPIPGTGRDTYLLSIFLLRRTHANDAGLIHFGRWYCERVQAIEGAAFDSGEEAFLAVGAFVGTQSFELQTRAFNG